MFVIKLLFVILRQNGTNNIYLMAEYNKNQELEERISQLPKDRLRDYYRYFVKYHDEVIRSFNNNDYDNMPMRKAVDALCKVLFHEILGSEADEYYRDGGASGNRFILSDRTPNNYFCFNQGTAYKRNVKTGKVDGDYTPHGEILQIATAIAHKKGYNQNDNRYNRFKSVHETVYSYESNDKEHVSADIDKSKITLNGRVHDYESFVHGILSLFKNDLRVPLQDYIASTTQTNYGQLKEGEAQYAVQLSEKTETLIELLNEELSSAYPSPLLLILPEKVDSRLAQSLVGINWNLIITFDPKADAEGHFLDILRKDWNEKRPFKIGDLLGGGVDETGIIFGNGQWPERPVTKYKDWNKIHEANIKSIIKKLRKGAEKICAVCITDGSDNKLYNRAWVEPLHDGDDVIIVGEIGPNLEERIEDDFTFNEIFTFDIPIDQAVYAFKNLNRQGHDDRSSLSLNVNEEDLLRYSAHGIKIITPIKSGTPKAITPITVFYAGGNINETDLYNGYDVQRGSYKEIHNLIKTRIDNGARFTHYIQQTTSCGATTFAMRLAYDIAYSSEKGNLKNPVTVIYISELKTESVNPLIERIKDLALKVSPNTILAFIDRSIQKNNFERIKESLSDGGSIKISFVRISESEKGGNEFTTQLKDELKQEELVDFVQKYRNHAKAMPKTADKEIENKWEELKYVIDFPMSLSYNDGKKLSIREYIENTISEFHGAKNQLIKQILLLISFSSTYVVNTDSYVESYLFNNIVGRRFLEWYKNQLTHRERKSFERIVKFEKDDNGKHTGRIKTRFSKFNRHIVDLYGNSLTQLASEYIANFFKNEESVDKLIDDYIINLFFKREEYEEDNSTFTGKSEQDKFYNKLSSVFKDIKDVDSISLVFDELDPHVGNHPRYLLSKAQYLYNRAYYMDSEEHNSRVFDKARDLLELTLDNSEYSQENKSVIYQSLGVLKYRRLGALRKVPVKDERIIEIAEDYLKEIIKDCDKAYSINPYDTHAMVTKAQALKSFLNMTRDFLGCEKNNFKFCETDKYLDYTSQYESTLETLSGFVSNIDKRNSTTSQNQLISIYNELREFAFKLIGQQQNELYSVYKRQLESQNINNELKKIYANRLFQALIESPNNDIRNKIGDLSDEKLYGIEKYLNISIRIGNLSGYEKIFKLHLFNGRKEYEIGKEKQWLKDWIAKDESPLAQLWGNFYLGSLYFCGILLEGRDQKGWYSSASKYISESKRIADILKRNDTKEFFYFRRDNGLKCLTENANKATYMEGYVKEIRNNRQGIVMLDSGLEATFNPQGKFLMEDADKRTRIKAKVGFRFSGLGLYGVEIITRINDHNEPVNQNLSIASETINKADNNHNTGSNSCAPTIIHNTSTNEEKDSLEEGYIYPGILHIEHGRKYITGDWKEDWIEYLSIDGPIDDELYDGADVEFSVKKIINTETGTKRWIAFDINFPED